VSGNWSTLRMREAAHDLQNTSKEWALLALISPRVAIAPLRDLRARFIQDCWEVMQFACRKAVLGW
jgi:hypothetical protein